MSQPIARATERLRATIEQADAHPDVNDTEWRQVVEHLRDAKQDQLAEIAERMRPSAIREWWRSEAQGALAALSD